MALKIHNQKYSGLTTNTSHKVDDVTIQITLTKNLPIRIKDEIFLHQSFLSEYFFTVQDILRE